MASREGPIDFSLLSQEEKDKLRKQARERALADQKKAAQTAYFEYALEEEARALDPEQEEVEFTLELPIYAGHVMLNGVMYLHGGTYTVTRARFDSIADIVAHAWKHDASITEEEGRSRKSMGTSIKNGAVINPPRLSGAVRV
jgi:hypothetical protein